jgi:hypothetical protein
MLISLNTAASALYRLTSHNVTGEKLHKRIAEELLMADEELGNDVLNQWKTFAKGMREIRVKEYGYSNMDEYYKDRVVDAGTKYFNLLLFKALTTSSGSNLTSL